MPPDPMSSRTKPHNCRSRNSSCLRIYRPPLLPSVSCPNRKNQKLIMRSLYPIFLRNTRKNPFRMTVRISDTPGLLPAAGIKKACGIPDAGLKGEDKYFEVIFRKNTAVLIRQLFCPRRGFRWTLSSISPLFSFIRSLRNFSLCTGQQQ